MDLSRDLARRTISISLLMLVMLVAGAWMGSAKADTFAAWKVVETRGKVRVHPVDGDWTDVVAGMELGARTSIETASTGRAVLAKGADRITVAPNSMLSLPETAAATDPTILQNLGTLLFQVETRPERGFVVKTPLLAAAVKGTAFTVTVAEGRAAVHVVDGSVQVSAEASDESRLVYPGQTAAVLVADPGALSVLRSGTVSIYGGYGAPRVALNPPANARAGNIGRDNGVDASLSQIGKRPPHAIAKEPGRRDRGRLTPGVVRNADHPAEIGKAMSTKLKQGGSSSPKKP